MKIIKNIIIQDSWVINLVSYWKERLIKFYSTNSSIIENRVTKGIPVTILDLKTNESFEYTSVAEVARSFDTYPNKIWRVIKEDKLYLDRYFIKVKSYTKLNDVRIYNLLYTLYIKCFRYVLKTLRYKATPIMYILLLMILSIFICKYFFNILLICKNTYYNYIYNYSEIRVNYLRYVLEYKLTCYDSFNRINDKSILSNKLITLFEFKEKLPFKPSCFDKYISNKPGIAELILKDANLDFSSAIAIAVSPSLNRVELKNTNLSINTEIVQDAPVNALGIYSNKDYTLSILSNVIYNNRARSKEILNYESNILYVLVNNLSPSIY
jgi:hypothetical protein